MTQATLLADNQRSLSELPYEDLIRTISNTLATKAKANPELVIFETDVDGDVLWNMYLDYYPAEQRQNFTCNSCKYFFRRAAGLVYVDPTTFETRSAIWDSIPAEFQVLADQITAIVEKAKVTEPFTFSRFVHPLLGMATGGGYNHLHLNTNIPHLKLWATDLSDVAKTHEGYEMAVNSLGVITPERIAAVLEIFKVDKDFQNYPKIINVLETYNAFRSTVSKNHKLRHNQIWLLAVTRPDVARIVNTAVGEYITSTASAGVAKNIFLKMVDPLNYQRPSEAPSEGNVVVAEKLITKLGVGESFARRSASVSDITTWYWKPAAVEVETKGGLFDGVKTKNNKVGDNTSTTLNGGNKSWTVFVRDVLPTMVSIQVHAPNTGNYVGFNTAVNPEAPPIFRHDTLEARNPISKWVVHGGSSAYQWGLDSGYKDVLGILEGCGTDQLQFIFSANKVPEVGSCLFPEILIRELYPIRSTIEQYSQQTQLQATANPVVGLNVFPATVKVKTKTGTEVVYVIDRLE